MNKRLAPRLPCGPSLLSDEAIPLEGVTRKPSPLTNGIVAPCPPPVPQLLARGHDPSTYEHMRKPKIDSLSAPGSPPDSYVILKQSLPTTLSAFKHDLY